MGKQYALQIRITEDDKRIMQERAVELGQSLSSWARSLLIADALLGKPSKPNANEAKFVAGAVRKRPAIKTVEDVKSAIESVPEPQRTAIANYGRQSHAIGCRCLMCKPPKAE